MRRSWRTEWPSLGLLAAMIVLSALAWPAAPDRIAVHWGPSGEPDRFGGRLEGLATVPAAAVALYVLMTVVPRFDPLRQNYARFEGAYAGLRALVIAFLAALHAIVVAGALGRRVPVSVAVPLVCAGLFAAIGGLLDRLQPTWFVGIRTPWTLSSEASWVKTHRLGRRLFMAMGGATGLLAVMRVPWVYGAVLGMLLGVSALLIVYSYVAWKHDPHRTRPGIPP
ncbi:MAG: SdpI family protein [Armatimonadota bacterium]|nr:SdpI family protein [Armatimonadota bacterium]